MTCCTEDLLQGAYDLHIHSAPSTFKRLMDDIELLRAADAAGYAGILLKSHYESTAARADMANKYAWDEAAGYRENASGKVSATHAKAYGAIALNQPCGGLNPYAVVNALERGAKIVFLPTRDAANSLLSGDMPGDFFRRPGISVINEAGHLYPQLYEIFDLVRSYGACLATGHLSGKESILVCREGLKQGVRMILTHPEFDRSRIEKDVQKELADAGALIEKCWYNIGESQYNAQKMADNIRLVGAERCYMTTDRGQKNREAPVEAMKRFIETMISCGISTDEIRLMTHDVPASVVK